MGDWGCGLHWASEATSTRGWTSLAHAEGFQWPGCPVPSELHSTHNCSWLVEGGDEDLLGWGDGDEVAHVWGPMGTPFLLLPGLVQCVDVEQGVSGVSAQDGKGVSLAQAGW